MHRVVDSKIRIPKPDPQFIRRNRLFDRFRRLAPGGSIVLTAPAGYGKTVLASQFLFELPERMKCWLSLDNSDSNPEVFARHLLGSLSRPIANLSSAGFLDHHSNGRSTPMSVLSDLCSYLDEYRGPYVWIVLDNYEAVDENPEIRSLIEFLLSGAANKLRFVICSRIKPKLRLSKLREARRLDIIGHNELRMTREEYRQALEDQLSVRIDDGQFEAIYEHSQGWCVSIGLARETARHGGITRLIQSLHGNLNPGIISDYLEEEILSSLPPSMRDFLFRCSLLETLSQQSCAVFCSDPCEVTERLNLLRASGIPLTILGENELQLHPLVRSSCRTLLKRQCTADELRTVSRCAADHSLACQDVRNAVELLIAFGDYSRALEVALDNWVAILAQGGRDALKNLLSILPEGLQSEPLAIDANLQMLSFEGRYGDLVAYCDTKLRDPQLVDGNPVLGKIWVTQTHCAALTGKKLLYKDAVEAWGQFEKTRGPFGPEVLVIVHDFLGFIAYDELRIPSAIRHIEQALALSPQEVIPSRFKYRSLLALLNFELGNTALAKSSLEQLAREARTQDPTASLALVDVFLARVLTYSGEYEEALTFIQQVRSETNPAHAEMITVHLDRYAGLCRLYLGDQEAGLRAIRDSVSRANSAMLSESLTSAAILSFYKEVHKEAGTAAGDTTVVERHIPAEAMLCRKMLSVLISSRSGEYSQALEELSPVRQIAASGSLKPWQATCHLYGAYLHYRMGNRSHAIQCLKQGLQLTIETGRRTYPLAIAEVDAFILANSPFVDLQISWQPTLFLTRRDHLLRDIVLEELAHDRLTDHEKALLLEFSRETGLRGLHQYASSQLGDMNDILARASVRYLEAHPKMPLCPWHVRTLGRFSVTVDGRALIFVRPKSEILFQRLLLAHPGSMHEEELMEYLWPDSVPEKSRANLRTVVSAVRKSMDTTTDPQNKSPIHLDRGCYSLVVPADSAVDFRELEATYQRAIDDVSRNGGFSRSFENDVSNVLESYEGDLLPHLQYDKFAEMRREQLKHCFFGLSAVYISALLDSSRFDEAQKYVEKGLALDPLWVEGVRLAMHLFGRSGRILLALKAYRKFESILGKELNVEPDADLQALFESLRQ